MKASAIDYQSPEEYSTSTGFKHLNFVERDHARIIEGNLEVMKASFQTLTSTLQNANEEVRKDQSLLQEQFIPIFSKI